MIVEPKRRKDDIDISTKADDLIKRVDEAVERLNKILIGEHGDDTET